MNYPMVQEDRKQELMSRLQVLLREIGDVDLKNLTTMPLQAAGDAFLNACKARWLSPHTIEDYSRTLRMFIAFNGDMPMNDVTPVQISSFLGSLQNVKAKTIRNRHIGLAAFWTWAIKQELVERHVVRMVDKPQEVRVVIEPFTNVEVRALLSAVARKPRRDQAIIYLLLDCGIRASELLGLKNRDIDFNSRQIKVMGKGAKERMIPFSEKTATVLAGHMKNVTGDMPFPLKRRSLNWMLIRLGKRAGVENCHPHRIRHTFAITFLRNDGNMFALQKLLGHTTMEMTRRYLAIAQADLERAHLKASPVTHWDLLCDPKVREQFLIKGPQNEKARDMFLRREAGRLGFVLKKDLKHKRTNEHQGGYMIRDKDLNIIAGGSFELTLDQVAEFLNERERQFA